MNNITKTQAQEDELTLPPQKLGPAQPDVGVREMQILIRVKIHAAGGISIGVEDPENEMLPTPWLIGVLEMALQGVLLDSRHAQGGNN